VEVFDVTGVSKNSYLRVYSDWEDLRGLKDLKGFLGVKILKKVKRLSVVREENITTAREPGDLVKEYVESQDTKLEKSALVSFGRSLLDGVSDGG